jgi:hypothetical protein
MRIRWNPESSLQPQEACMKLRDTRELLPSPPSGQSPSCSSASPSRASLPHSRARVAIKPDSQRGSPSDWQAC